MTRFLNEKPQHGACAIVMIGFLVAIAFGFYEMKDEDEKQH